MKPCETKASKRIKALIETVIKDFKFPEDKSTSGPACPIENVYFFFKITLRNSNLIKN